MAKEKGKPLAYRGIYVDTAGNRSVRLYDINTGALLPVGAENNYEIYDSYNAAVTEMNAEATKAEEDHIKTHGDAANSPKFDRKEFILSRAQGHKDPNLSGDYKHGRDEGNNYGYIDTPGILGLAGKLPGPLGLVGKVLGATANANKTAAINTARSRMGMSEIGVANGEETGIGQLAKGIAQSVGALTKDRQGFVARVQAPNEKQYSVGLEAQDKQGRTTLTPEEAIKRGVYGPEMEITKQDKKTVTGKKPGVFGSILSKLGQALAPTKTPSTPIGAVAGAVGNVVNSVKEGNIIGKLTGIDFDKDDATPAVSKETVTGTAPASTTVAPSKPGSIADAYSKSTPVDRATDLQNTPSTDSRFSTRQPTNESLPNANTSWNLGPNRPNKPKAATTNMMTAQIAETFGPDAKMNAISGKGEYGSHRHRKGDALDFDVIKPDGTLATYSEMKDYASQLAYNNPTAGIGLAPGYMGATGQRIHVDTKFGGYWGRNESKYGMEQSLRDTIDAARAGFRPTPFSSIPTPAGNNVRSPANLDYFDYTPEEVEAEKKSVARQMIEKVKDDALAYQPQYAPTNKVQTQTINRPTITGQTYSQFSQQPAVDANRFSFTAPPNGFTQKTLSRPTDDRFDRYTAPDMGGIVSQADKAKFSPEKTSQFGVYSPTGPAGGEGLYSKASDPSASATGRATASQSSSYNGGRGSFGTSGATQSGKSSSTGRSSSSSGGYSGKSGGNYTGGSGRASSFGAATGGSSNSGSSRSSGGYSGASGAGKTGGSGRATSASDATGRSTGGISGAGKGHSSTAGGAGGHSGGKNDRGGFAGL